MSPYLMVVIYVKGSQNNPKTNLILLLMMGLLSDGSLFLRDPDSESALVQLQDKSLTNPRWNICLGSHIRTVLVYRDRRQTCLASLVEILKQSRDPAQVTRSLDFVVFNTFNLILKHSTQHLCVSSLWIREKQKETLS